MFVWPLDTILLCYYETLVSLPAITCFSKLLSLGQFSYSNMMAFPFNLLASILSPLVSSHAAVTTQPCSNYLPLIQPYHIFIHSFIIHELVIWILSWKHWVQYTPG